MVDSMTKQYCYKQVCLRSTWQSICICQCMELHMTVWICCLNGRVQAINRHTEAEMQYTGVMDAIKRMLADEGIAGFYKGVQAALQAQTIRK